MDQTKIFLDVEGDSWFSRNRAAIDSKSNYYETDIIKRILGHDKTKINAILEVGCGNGAKLDDLCKFFNATGMGIDPSGEAIKSGRRTYDTRCLSVGTAAKLPYEDAYFDLVYFGFCLYLVDRSNLLQAVAEADRVLKSGGFLAILDFDPKQRHKRPYHHRAGIFSYKTSYADFFTQSGHYYLVGKESFSHSTHYFTEDSDERVSMSILYKEPEPY
jgi:ubiquinone/menaquinone biosynthesis C-methylase UbiE